ncbi:MAG TPA: PilZ domain-containing protein, partial [Myxococcota bacterium]|nr:PilZ domain-containing protein [Myxococcota bacterium]
MILKALVVADPVGNIAELVTTQCRRLATERLVATTGTQALALVSEYKPEVVVVSLELARPPIEKLVPKLIKIVPDVLIVASFRELAVPKMEQLNRLGVDDFVAHPINATEIFRAVSRRFHMAFRQHQRFNLHLDVLRADGVTLGRTLDVSVGGMRLELYHPLHAGESVLIDVMLPTGHKLRARCRLLSIEGTAPAK